MASTGPEVQGSIDTLRQAFSLDVNKPFELKPTLGMRSPTMEHTVAPAVPQQQMLQQPTRHGSLPTAQTWSHLQTATPAAIVSPTNEFPPTYSSNGIASTLPNPSTISYNTSSFDMPSSSSYQPQSLNQVSNPGYQQQPYALEPVISNEQTTPVWDPSVIFNQWNTAFGNPAQPSQPSPPDSRYAQAMAASSMMQQQPLQSPPVNGPGSYMAGYIGGNQAPQIPQQIPDNLGVPSVQTITPVMWQDAFTSAYVSGHGQKRFRDDGSDAGYDVYGAKRRG
jgi:hypothetical protein